MAIAAGVKVWLIVMLSGSGCIEPPRTDPTWEEFWDQRYDRWCCASTIKTYWIVGIGAGLITSGIGLNRAYGPICTFHKGKRN